MRSVLHYPVWLLPRLPTARGYFSRPSRRHACPAVFLPVPFRPVPISRPPSPSVTHDAGKPGDEYSKPLKAWTNLLLRRRSMDRKPTLRFQSSLNLRFILLMSPRIRRALHDQVTLRQDATGHFDRSTHDRPRDRPAGRVRAAGTLFRPGAP